jgi:tetratricopeptide (TPR) repeat protein
VRAVLSAAAVFIPIASLHAQRPSPDPARTRLEQARALAAKDRHAEALEALAAAVALHRGDVEISREYQNALLRAGRRDQAVREYRALAEAHPDEATWHYLHGRLLAGEEMERGFKRALALDPSFFWAHFGLGQYRLDADRPGDAVPHLQTARDLRPDLPDVHDALAKALYFAGRFEEAEAAWREAARRFPDSAASRIGLGVLYKTVGQANPEMLPRAVVELEAVVKRWPEAWAAYEPLIQACYAAGRTEQAEVHRAAARRAGARGRRTEMTVDIVGLDARVLLVRERLDAAAEGGWIVFSVKGRGREAAETPVAVAVPTGAEGVDLYGADPARPEGRGALLEHYAARPAHAALVDRVRRALVQ